MNRNSRASFRVLGFLCACAFTIAVAAPGLRAANQKPLPRGVSVIASTVPSNGDVNPYGLTVIPNTTGYLTQGDLLVSNFNNSSNLQGTGTTIMQIGPSGSVSQFAQIDPNNLPGPCPGGIGLTTALNVLQTGWVIVGSLPTTDGTSATAQAGCILVLDSYGNVAETFDGSLINGPWDSTVVDNGKTAQLFITNVLNGTVAGNGKIVNRGSVVRIDLVITGSKMPAIESMTIVGSGFPERTDPAALVIGPTGVGVGGTNLYVADSLDNRVAVISNGLTRTTSDGTGTTFTKNGSLNDPLGLLVLPNGDVVTVNGNDGYGVETTASGQQIHKALLDNTGTPPGAGALFGIVYVPGTGLYFVDDASNTLNLFK
jgi:hypothetical protein